MEISVRLKKGYMKERIMSEALLGEGQLNWCRDGLILTEQQKQSYEKNGYLLIRNCVPAYEIDRYLKRFQRLCELDRKEFPEMIVMRDVTIAKSEFKPGEQAITKLQDFQNDPVLFDYCRYPTIVDVVKDLIGKPDSNLIAMHTMLINKPPDTGSLTSRHPMHQDLPYFPFRPADFICCSWTAMERINRANGCLVVVPGSHKGPLLQHGYPKWEGGVNKAYYGIQNYDPSTPRLHVEMEAGDTLFFHPLIIHGSGANRTTGFRKAISCHYANDDFCRYDRSTMQEEMNDEIIEMAKKKMRRYGIEAQVDIADIWRLKGREVNGTRSNL